MEVGIKKEFPSHGLTRSELSVSPGIPGVEMGILTRPSAFKPVRIAVLYEPLG